ncbi:MAG TPA: hypothetical protein VGM25_08965 [Caulobacteraceae bacterium]|jgi:hypothetical protein
MRYWEIIEGRTNSGARAANDVWKQTQRTADALRVLRAKQAKAAADRVAAQGMPGGRTRSDRLRAADRREADARRVYDDARNKANAAMSKAIAGAYSKD